LTTHHKEIEHKILAILYIFAAKIQTGISMTIICWQLHMWSEEDLLLLEKVVESSSFYIEIMFY
jgi:hypothetical protein